MPDLCSRCGRRPARDGLMTCEVCAGKAVDRMHRQKNSRIAAGLCPTCGKPMDREGYSCTACNAKMTEYHREIRQDRKRLHLCTRCMAKDERTLEGYATCKACAEKDNERHRAQYRGKKAAQDG